MLYMLHVIYAMYVYICYILLTKKLHVSAGRGHHQDFPQKHFQDCAICSTILKVFLTGGGRSVGIVRSRTKATEFSLFFNQRIV